MREHDKKWETGRLREERRLGNLQIYTGWSDFNSKATPTSSSSSTDPLGEDGLALSMATGGRTTSWSASTSSAGRLVRTFKRWMAPRTRHRHGRGGRGERVQGTKISGLPGHRQPPCWTKPGTPRSSGDDCQRRVPRWIHVSVLLGSNVSQ